MMAYNQGCIASIIVDENPIREFNYKNQRTCRVPFGSEYSIRLKNKTSGRCLVSVFIDGTDVLNFHKLILRPNSDIDLERFIDDLIQGRKFKFVSLEEGMKTGEIQDPSSKENGVVTIKFYKEIIPRSLFNSGCKGGGSSLRGVSNASYASCNLGAMEFTPQECGATVEGQVSNQQFGVDNTYFPTELIPVEIVIKMIGHDFRKKIGLYLDKNKKPSHEFNSREDAFEFAKLNDFGSSSVTIKEC